MNGLGPGTTSPMSLDVGSGSYAFRCLFDDYDPLDEQTFLVNTINQIEESKYWASTAIRGAATVEGDRGRGEAAVSVRNHGLPGWY